MVAKRVVKRRLWTGDSTPKATKDWARAYRGLVSQWYRKKMKTEEFSREIFISIGQIRDQIMARECTNSPQPSFCFPRKRDEDEEKKSAVLWARVILCFPLPYQEILKKILKNFLDFYRTKNPKKKIWPGIENPMISVQYEKKYFITEGT